MIDSVLKGTGNSRFLKSAVPAGTSWADALAMLQAGTFPIDFNGINTDGFQQVGTPLNKANLLKDATAAQIGLPPSTTPDGMFQALGNTGELHVWRKTVVNSQPQDAYYSLGSIITTSGTIIDLSKQNVNQVGFRLSDSVMVLPDGSVSLVDPKMYYKYTYNSNMYEHRYVASDGTYIIDGNFSGKFISFYADSPSYYGSNYITLDKIYYIPATASFTYGAKLKISQLQPVIGHAAITAVTTTTYPVSTNPNAYQEGDDAKEAGYVVGDVVTGQFKMSERYPDDGYYYKYAGSISVADNGTISLNSPSQISFDRYNGGQSYANSCLTEIAGKFVYLANRDSGTSAPDSKPPFNSVPSGVVYIPSDATLTWTDGGALDGFILSKYQPVTGYAAIPAGTTIEYLGKLGDKARVQVVSYVGTGTYGKDNKNQLTFSRKPRFIMVPGAAFGYAYIPNGMFYYVIPGDYATLENLHCVWNDDTNTMTWYHSSYPYRQYNESGRKYTFVAIY